MEALGESLDRFLEALGRIWESKWSECSFKIEGKMIENSDLDFDFLFFSYIVFTFACLAIDSKIVSIIPENNLLKLISLVKS